MLVVVSGLHEAVQARMYTSWSLDGQLHVLFVITGSCVHNT